MRCVIHNHYTELSKIVEGVPAAVEAELIRMYPWLNASDPESHGDVGALIDQLNSNQAFDAFVDFDQEPQGLVKTEHNLGEDDENHVISSMLGYQPKLHAALDAVRFLTGGQAVAGDKVRQALYQADGDPEEAALAAYGLDVNETNLKALRGVQGLSKSDTQPVSADTVEAGHPDADEAADEIRRSFRDSFVMPVELGGKHSKGSLLARDEDSGNTWLLKPGSGGQTPAAGASQDPSSQSRREAAFWHVADAWHLGQFLPRADLVLVDGKEYAAIHLLPWSYKNLDKIKTQDPGAVRNILAEYLSRGLLHRWAVLDFVLGNPDRHAANLMVKDGDVKLIDHGSAMAGTAFDPAHDQNSFTPYYLRAWAPGKFAGLDEADKLKYMPRLGRQAEIEFRAWLDTLQGSDLDKVLLRYGVDPAPAKARLAQVKALGAAEPVDLAINKLWVET